MLALQPLGGGGDLPAADPFAVIACCRPAKTVPRHDPHDVFGRLLALNWRLALVPPPQANQVLYRLDRPSGRRQRR